MIMELFVHEKPEIKGSQVEKLAYVGYSLPSLINY